MEPSEFLKLYKLEHRDINQPSGDVQKYCDYLKETSKDLINPYLYDDGDCDSSAFQIRGYVPKTKKELEQDREQLEKDFLSAKKRQETIKKQELEQLKRLKKKYEQ